MTKDFSTPKEYSRHLRKNQTPSESVLWEHVRNRRLQGYKFLRQHPIKIWKTDGRFYFYFADFYCARKRLVVEVDGPVHIFQQEEDAARDATLQEYGYQVLHVTNDDVNKNIVSVLNKIINYLSLPSPGGEDSHIESECINQQR